MLRARGALAVLAWALAASALTSMLAFALHALASGLYGPVSTASGTLIVPAAVAALIVALRDGAGDVARVATVDVPSVF